MPKSNTPPKPPPRQTGGKKENKPIPAPKTRDAVGGYNNISSEFIKKIGEFFIEQNDNGLAVIEKEKIIFSNKNFAEFTGFEQSELSQKPFIDLIPTEYKKIVGSAFGIKNASQPPRKYKLSMLSKNESVFPAEINIRPFEIDGSLYFILVLSDITEKKWTEEILRENEEKYKDLFDNANDIIQSISVSGHFIYVNRSWKEVLGYSDKEIAALTIFDIIHPESSEYWASTFAKLLKGEETEKTIELSLVKKNGEKITVEGNLGCKFVNNKPVAQRSILRDITQRKAAEDALKNAKDYAERLIQTANVMIVGLNEKGGIVIFNEEAEKLTGYTKKDMEGKNLFEVLIPKQKYPLAWKAFSNWQKTGEMPSLFENPILTRDGKERFISWRNGELTMNGVVEGTISFGIDITDRKIAEESLKQSEERNRKLIEYLPDAILVYSEGRILYVNPAGAKLLGAKSHKELVGRSISNFLPVHAPEDEQTNICLTNFYMNASGEVENCSSEGKLIKLDGEIIDVDMKSLPFEYQGKIASQLVFHDITAEKKAKKELTERNAELENMNKLMIGRELKMVELKNRLKEMDGGTDQTNK
jgi:PAS domain S-box-containing protein